MPFLVSPGVAVVEKDYTSIVPSVSTSTGAYAGAFSWGPIADPIKISSETELAAKFGAPVDSNYQSFFSAANFLAYTNSLFVNRIDAAGLKNATDVQSGGVLAADIEITEPGVGYTLEETSTVTVAFSAPNLDGVTATATLEWEEYATDVWRITNIQLTEAGTGYTSPPTITITAPAAGTQATARVNALTVDGVKVKNLDDYLENFSTGHHLHGAVAAKYAGSKANGLMVLIIDNNNWQNLDSATQKKFSGRPGTSAFAETNIGPNTMDEVHVLIMDGTKGTFSGVPGTVLEKFEYLSKLTDAKLSDGTSVYWKDAINFQSNYLWVLDQPSTTVDSLNPTALLSNVGASFASTTVDNVTTNTITFTTNETELTEFSNFFNINYDNGVQIKVTGSDANNGIYTVLDVVVTTGVSTVITVLENVTPDVDAAATFERVAKLAWNQSSQQALTAGEGAKTFDLMSSTAITEIVLAGGADDYAVTDGNIQTAYSVFANTDNYDISLIVTGNVSATVANYVISNVAETRRDCIAFVSPRNTTVGMPHWITATQAGVTPVAAAIAYKNAVNISTSYAVMDSGWKYQYDRYNDKYRWIPLNADTAGLCARVDFTADPWYSPGGFNRGQVKNVVKLGYNPNQTQRDDLYLAGINPVVTFPGQGTVLFGDKTMLAKPSAFDRINVRRLFIVLEKAISTAAKFQLFEFNDSFTRAQFRNLVEPFLRDVQGRRGVVDFRVVCDETNNTGEVIDRNEFAADIFIKPNRSINFITLTFVAARSSVSFDEIGA